MLDWSYALLSDREQRVFERLSVFAGGWTIQAAESVCAHDNIDSTEVLERLARLANASLVVYDRSLGGSSRYRMLDVVRQYAHECLSRRSELEETRCRHAGFFVNLAERIAPKFHQADQLTWLHTMEQEHDNYRAALKYFVEYRDGVSALRLAGALAGFWVRRGYVQEGRDWLERVLAESRDAPTAIRMVALRGAGSLAAYHHDFASAREVQSEALTLARAVGDQRSIAASLNSLGYTELSEGNYTAAMRGASSSRLPGDRWTSVEARSAPLYSIRSRKGSRCASSLLKLEWNRAPVPS